MPTARARANAPQPNRHRMLARLCAPILLAALLLAWVSAGSRADSSNARLAAGPVPAHTRATSISFVSPERGYLLGTAPCRRSPCSVILRTLDGGRSWVGLPAPRQSVGIYMQSGLWGLRFAGPRDGFAFGEGLWETTDAAHSWRRVPAPAPAISDLEVVGGRELVALADSCAPSNPRCHSSFLLLYHRPLRGGSWARVPVPVSREAAGSGAIAVSGSRVWVLDVSRLLLSTNAGRSFGSVRSPCSGRGAAPAPASIAERGRSTYLLCLGQPGAGSQPKYVYRLEGTRWRLAGEPPMAGVGGEIAVGSDHAIIVASNSGASWLFRSADGGRRWSSGLTLDNGGISWGDVGFITPTHAYAVEGPATGGRFSQDPFAIGQLWLSDNGGRSWFRSRL
jgi:hypothetical protein